MPIPDRVSSTRPLDNVVPADAPRFVREVTAQMMRGHGDELPVSALPHDGTYPSATTRYEKSNVSDRVPLWEPDLVITSYSIHYTKLYDDGMRADERTVPALDAQVGFP